MNIQYPPNEVRLPTIELHQADKPHLHHEEMFYGDRVNYNNYIYGPMKVVNSQYNITDYPTN
ncbi:MAG: hypothetical protein E6H08_13530 [Bacteroidetes bacterium]|nr:MAG: hypothetical protein E6H08_13530 [Bacteroidota bacterium]